MKRLLITRILVTVGFVLCTSLSAYSQEVFQLKAGESSMEVKGTSTLHDWSMKASDLSGFVKVKLEGQELEILDSRLSAKANKIVSDNKTMDKKAHEALRADKHENISFRYSSVKLDNRKSSHVSGEIAGVLSIAGVSREVRIPFTGQIDPSGKFNVNGTISLKQTDFNMVPPTALMGTIKTGDQVNVLCNLVFTRGDAMQASSNVK